MSGVAAGGLVLGVVPLIISAVENYEVTLRPFLTYYRHCRELKDFRTALGTQKQLFHNNCLVLLGKVQAHGLLEGPPNEESKSNADLRVAQYLGHSFGVCESLIRQIEEAVLGIQDETHCLKEWDPKATSNIDKAWRQAFRQKVRFSISKPRLSKKIDELRHLNDDFVSLIRSIDDLQDVRLKADSVAHKALGHSIEKFKFIRTASLRLHEALANIWSCPAHEHHSANISLKKIVEMNKPDAADADHMCEVRFDMAFDVYSTSTEAIQVPVWFEIETSTHPYNDNPAGSPIFTASTSATASPNQPAEAISDRNNYPSTSNNRSSGMPLGQTLQIGASGMNSNNPSRPNTTFRIDDRFLPELCARQDLCLHLQRSYSNCENDQLSATSICIGVLQKTRTFKHLVFQRPATQCPNSSVSLETVISGLSVNKPFGGLTSLERVQLALSLAKAVLQFHASPWLPEDWRSHNVRFYVIDTSAIQQQPGSLKAPFLHLMSSKSCSAAAKGTTTGKSITKDPLSPIRNNVLFGLGVILLELGSESPLKSIHIAEDLNADRENPYFDYLAAQRLKTTIGRPLGARYGRIARRCLDCEFDVGEHDLKDPTLQMAFFKDVILELEELEVLLKGL